MEEEIGFYWDSLTGDDQKIWYASEVYSKHMYGIKSVDDDALEKLRTRDRRDKAVKELTTSSGKVVKPKHIEGDSRYDILCNITY